MQKQRCSVRDTILLVGNGFSIDFAEHLGLTPSDLSFPFSMTVRCTEPEWDNVLDDMTELRQYIESHQQQGAIGGFELCRCLCRDLQGQPFRFGDTLRMVHAQMRQYVALAYSTIQLRFDQYSATGWRYTNALRSSGSALLGCISFNYDLVLERALDASRLGYHRPFICPCEQGFVLVFKPHGSIDFEAGPGTFFQPPETRFHNVSFLNEAIPMRALAPDEYLRARIFSDIVLPSEPSPQARLYWVRSTYDRLRHVAHRVHRLVIVGISYWDCDRQEIDAILDHMPDDCVFHLVNPHPPEDIILRLESSGRDYRVNEWTG